MKHFVSLLLFVCAVSITSAADPKKDTGESLARIGMMRIRFQAFDEVTEPDTERREYVFHLNFLDIPIPKPPLVLRRGDKVAGYLIGELRNPEPKRTPNDGIVPGTETTLEVTHIDSGKKHILELGRIYTVPRDQ
jgi:hypothetical protein